jgi:hypothetical protein
VQLDHGGDGAAVAGLLGEDEAGGRQRARAPLDAAAAAVAVRALAAVDADEQVAPRSTTVNTCWLPGRSMKIVSPACTLAASKAARVAMGRSAPVCRASSRRFAITLP